MTAFLDEAAVRQWALTFVLERSKFPSATPELIAQACAVAEPLAASLLFGVVSGAATATIGAGGEDVTASPSDAPRAGDT